MNNLWQELKRRHVVKAGLAYLVSAWLIIQVLSILFPTFEASPDTMKTAVIVLGIGFPIWLIIAWIYDFSPKGIKKTEAITFDPELSRKKNINLNRFIIGGLSIAVVLLIVNQVRLTQKIDFDQDGRLTIAVLPFDNFSPNPDNEWIGDGVTEDLLTHLSKIEEFRVISRTSVMKYKNSNKSLPEIAKELGASHLLEGSIRVSDKEVLISAQLVDSRDSHIWANNYRNKSGNIFDLQSNVAKEATKAIFGKLTKTQEQELSIKQDIDPEARKNLVLGNRLLDNLETKYWDEAEVYFEKALHVEPNWEKALSSLAYVKVWKTPKIGDSLANKALAIDPKSEKAFAAKAIALVYQGKYNESMSSLEKAINLNKDAPWSHDYLASLYLFGIGIDEDYKKALYHSTEAVKIDPLSQIFSRKQIYALIELERFQEADSLTLSKEFLFNDQIRTYIERNKIGKIAEVKSRDSKDYTKALEILNEAIDTFPADKAYYQRELAGAYDGYFNNNKKYLEYTKVSWENRETIKNSLGTTLSIAMFYVNALLENEHLDEARDFINSQELLKELDESEYLMFKRNVEFEYHITIGDYEKAKDFVDGNVFYQIVLNAHIGNLNEVYKALKGKELTDPTDRAIVFAILTETDSVFKYLNHEKIYAPGINSNPVFDPYRKDPRFIAFREKHYLHDVSME
jgi:TolB-like protein/TPR repeat protein